MEGHNILTLYHQAKAERDSKSISEQNPKSVPKASKLDFVDLSDIHQTSRKDRNRQVKEASHALLQHERLRKIELQLTLYREKLETRQLHIHEVEKKVAEKRKVMEEAEESDDEKKKKHKRKKKHSSSSESDSDSGEKHKSKKKKEAKKSKKKKKEVEQVEEAEGVLTQLDTMDRKGVPLFIAGAYEQNLLRIHWGRDILSISLWLSLSLTLSISLSL
jgi:hypothetical protein